MHKKFIISGISSGFIIIVLIIFNLGFTKSDHRKSWEQYLSAMYKKMPLEADNPDLAALQNYYMTIDPALKAVPRERLYDAYQQTKALDLQKKSPGLEWVETGSNMGGRTRAIMWDPNDTAGTRIWAGSVTGGIWYNNDIFSDSSTWLPVNDHWPSLSISSLVYDPNDPMVFYAGTGEYQTARIIYRESSGVGIGIWKSIDGGESWDIIPSTEDFKYISDLKIRIENGISVLYAGVVSGFYQGANFVSEPSEGLYRSIDGGLSWDQVLPNIEGEDVPYAPADLEIGPSGRIFVGTLKNLDGDGGATILYSDSGTIGTWAIFDEYEGIIQNDPDLPVPGRVILACSPSDENRVYALVGAGWLNSTNFNYARGKYILKSTDGGQSWTETNLPGGSPDWATISWHAFIASVDPSDPDKLYAGGKDVWKTTNAGYSWIKVSDWTLMYSGGGDDYVHCDQHVQDYINNSSDEMVLVTDGGIFYTDNASSSIPIFQEKNQGYSTLQFYTCDIYPIPGYNYFVGGLQDNGTLLYMGDPLDVFNMIDGGDGAYCFFDETEPEIMITSTYFNLFTLFYNWNNAGEMGMDGTGVFINPADYDSENNILYANAIKFNNSYPNQILRVTGIPDNPVNQLVTLPVNLNSYFSHVKVSPYSPEGSSTIFLGSQNGRIFKVTNAQNNPDVTEIGSNDLPIAYLSSIALGGSEDTLLITFTNYGVVSVWQSYNGGESWENIEGNLPDMPIRWGIYHPENNKMVMLATEIGIWTTNDASATDVEWEHDPDMPNVRIDMLQMRNTDNTVLAATHGRGLIYANWDYDYTVQLDEKICQEFKIYPNPANNFIHIDLGFIEKADIIILNQNGRLVFEGAMSNKDKINVSAWTSGIYYLKTQYKNSETVSKFIIR